MGFTSPDAKTIHDAIGDTSQLPVQSQRAFTPDRDAFSPIPTPSPGDWLAVHQEQDQTFEQFTASSPNRPTPNRHVIYFQPLGDFAAERSPSLEKLREFAAAFFAMEVKTLPSAPIEKFPTRRNPFTHNPQILTTDVLRFLKARVPADASVFWRSQWKTFIPNLPGILFLARLQYTIALVFTALLATTLHFTAKRAPAVMKSSSYAGAVKFSLTKQVTCLG